MWIGTTYPIVPRKCVDSNIQNNKIKKCLRKQTSKNRNGGLLYSWLQEECEAPKH